MRSNFSISDILCKISDDRGHNRTDSLPMMDSIAWPIGSNDELKIYQKVLYTTVSVGIGFLDAFVLFIGGGGGCRVRWHRTLVFVSNYKMGKFIVLPFCTVECILCFATIFFLCFGILWDTGTICVKDLFYFNHKKVNNLPATPHLNFSR